jgi:hypothetical protein
MCQSQTITKDLSNRTLFANCVAFPTEALGEGGALLNKKKSDEIELHIKST